MKAGIVALRAGKMNVPSGEEERDPLDAAWAAVDRAESDRAGAVIDALLAGASQRDVARRSGLAVNTVRGIMLDAGIRYTGQKYTVVPEGVPDDHQ